MTVAILTYANDLVLVVRDQPGIVSPNPVSHFVRWRCAFKKLLHHRVQVFHILCTVV